MFKKIWLKIKNIFAAKLPATSKQQRIFINKQLNHYESNYQFFETSDAKIAYFVREDEKKEPKKNVLFLHGMTEDSLNWFYAVEYLYIKSSHYRSFALDLPGFGQTQFENESVINLHRYVEIIKEFLDYHNIDKINLVGHSLGGQTAGLFAYHYPDRVEKLILVDTAGLRRFNVLASAFFKAMPVPGNMLKQISYLDWVKLLSNTTMVEDEAVFRKSFYDVAIKRKNNITEYIITRNYQKLLQDGLKRVSAIKKSMSAMLEPTTYIDDKLPKLSIPICFLWGEEDKLVPLKYGIQGYDSIHSMNKKIFVFKKTGHYPLLERPRDFAEVVFNFLEQ